MTEIAKTPDSIENEPKVNKEEHSNVENQSQKTTDTAVKTKKPMSTSTIILIIIGVIVLGICCCCASIMLFPSLIPQEFYDELAKEIDTNTTPDSFEFGE